jgi:TetR/AcrR family transcriptional regulator, transcriptional repressor for nem operon
LAEVDVMPYSPDHKKSTRQRILKTAARLFNQKGFSEASIEGIMSAAGLTHGGFYRHFNSKDELYAEAVRNFLHPDVQEPWQKPRPALCDPKVSFARYVVDAYLSREHLDDVDGSCPLIGIPSDVARSSPAVKAAYREVAESMIRLFEANLNGPRTREQALVLTALCVGGMVLARGIDDQHLADDIRNAAHKQALKRTDWSNGRPRARSSTGSNERHGKERRNRRQTSGALNSR